MKPFSLVITLFLGFSCLPLNANDRLGKGPLKKLYLDNCASCHGKNMEGGMAGSLLDDTWEAGGSDEELAKSIAKGIPGTAMVGFEKTITDEKIRGLVILIREQRLANAMPQDSTASPDGIYQSKLHDFRISTVMTGKDTLWGLDFLPNGDLLVTQKDGKLWHFSNGKTKEITGLPEVFNQRQGGLLDVAVHPGDKDDPWVYLSFSDPARDKSSAATSIVRGKIKQGKWTKQDVIFSVANDKRDSRGYHFGSRTVLQDGYVFFSIGDAGQQTNAQDLTNHNGKIHRLHDDGRIPKDNPFVNNKDAVKSIWTYGNRNPQGLDIHPITGALWEAEHGPRGGDEVNIIEKGKNYGWPVITYGMNYDGTPMTDKTAMAGMEQPKHYWTPSIAACGIEFYEGSQFPQWKNNLFVASLASKELHRLTIDKDTVIDDEIVLKGLGRIRDIANGPDGNLYVIINDGEHRVIKISPAGKKNKMAAHSRY